MLYRFCRSFFWRLGKRFFQLEVEDSEWVPAEGPALLVANHSSFLDPPVLGTSLWHRDVNFLARASLFRFPVFGSLLRRVHAIPVNTRGDWREGAKTVLERLAQGEVVGVFPEGTRTWDGRLQPGKPGVGWLAYRAKVPVIPAFIHGTYAALPRGARMIKFTPIRVVFGAPLDLSQYYTGPESRETYQRIAQAMMEGIRRAGATNSP